MCLGPKKKLSMSFKKICTARKINTSLRRKHPEHTANMSLSDLYTLVKLPRVSLSTDRAKVTRNFSSETLDIGISGASISNYILKPTPKLIWSHSIPPSFIVNSVDVKDDLYYVGILNKSSKKNLLQVIEKLENDSKLVKEIELDSKVLDIKVVEKGVIVVLEDGIISYDEDFKVVWKLESLFSTIYSQFISNDILLVVEYKLRKKTLNFRLVSTSTGLEVNSKILESTISNSELAFAFNSGILYQHSSSTNTLTLYKVPHFTEFKTIDLSVLSIPSAKTVTLRSPSEHRLIIAQDKDIILVNTNFSTVLSQVSSKTKVEILDVETTGKSLFGVALKNGEVSGLTIQLDSNTLRDSLGKRYTKEAPNQIKEVPSILDIKDETVDIDAILTSKNLDQTLKEYLQAENEYYTEKDKIVSSNFINKLVEQILTQEELPEVVLTYLLTHPLFPNVDGLLDKLRSKPRLLRQAVVTANVSLTELLSELNTTESDEIFKDIITRLLEFPKEKLNFKDLDNFRIVEKIINLNFGYELIALLIDSSGLFTWNEELVAKLQLVLNSKVDALNSASKTLSVIEQAELRNLKTVKKVPVYSIEKLTL